MGPIIKESGMSAAVALRWLRRRIRGPRRHPYTLHGGVSIVRLRRMSHQALNQSHAAARYMCFARAN
jgi:hypothetical protein